MNGHTVSDTGLLFSLSVTSYDLFPVRIHMMSVCSCFPAPLSFSHLPLFPISLSLKHFNPMFCSSASHLSYSLTESLIHSCNVLILINIHLHLQVLLSCSPRFMCHHTEYRRGFMITNTFIDSAVTEQSLTHKSYNRTPTP